MSQSTRADTSNLRERADVVHDGRQGAALGNIDTAGHFR
jgi:hypothetical protein